ncbi:hypothetical protein GGR56DRAFT_389574 [Xylariaceae sp. FL0804]|nr:hypothetical protein GGR56DRAFT_389574 [Xylariaceae sp. FL0804]
MAAGGGGDSAGPRSVTDATRFTTNTPHANSKSSTAPPTSGAGAPAGARAAAAMSKGGPAAGAPGGPAAGTRVAGGPQETLEERVRRLRAAHLAARQHKLSRADRIIDAGRHFFDRVHIISLWGILGFSACCFLFSIYAAGDMLLHNRKRRAEFFAVQKQIEENSLEAARLAYIKGTATAEQVSLVEDIAERARRGEAPRLPSLLSPPQPAAPPGGRPAPPNWEEKEAQQYEEYQQRLRQQHEQRSVFPGESMTETSLDVPDLESKGRPGGLRGWLFFGLKKDENESGDDNGTAVATATAGPEITQPPLPMQRVSGPSSGGEERSTTTTTLAQSVRDRASAALASERARQRAGGMLDQLGLAAGNSSSATSAAPASEKKKGWFGW